MDYSKLCFGCMEEKVVAQTCPRCGYDQTSGPASSHHLAPGTTLHDKYLIGKVLGQGGFGITYLAWDSILDLKLAIKEFFPMGLVARSSGNAQVETYVGDQGEQFSFGLDRFLGEAKTLARFSEHPNIVTVRDFFKENNTAYMVMNYLEGVTLQNYFADKGGIIPVEQALEIFMPVLDALKEVHNVGILHRDISPDNIFINQGGRVILIDFGAARQAMGDKSKSLSVIMKAGYSPPEQYQSRGKQGPWTDIYAVAATMYRAITGQTPSEAIDRMAEDDLLSPSKLGIAIEPKQEKILLKALAVKAGERFQAVEEFQRELIASSFKDDTNEGSAGVKPEKTTGFVTADKEWVEEDREQKLKTDIAEESIVPEKKPLSAQPPVDRGSKQETSYTISGKTVKVAALLVLCGLLLFGGIKLFSSGIYPDILADLDADYYIDYENGAIPIGDLPIGTRVVDPSWEWEFRTGSNYSGSGIVKPVTWIVVAKDHYDGLEPHVTLLTEELIGLHAFDNSTNRNHARAQYGFNHWGESGTANATSGLRPWLNSSGIHMGEGFYQAFSEDFRGAVIATILLNSYWKKGTVYSTKDNVFIPSTTEFGDIAHKYTYRIGEPYSYFIGVGNTKKRSAQLEDEALWYWTRSPDLRFGNYERIVSSAAASSFNFDVTNDNSGIRPALNLKSEIMVSEIRN
jgi:serine/threonine protein kinase